jgi:menaquinone-dependent protoporphyrinogen oxidase
LRPSAAASREPALGIALAATSGTMSNVLIAYATRQGQTEKIARRIAQTLRESGHEPRLLDTERRSEGEKLELERFQVAIVAAPIHAGGYPRSLLLFVREHSGFFASVPVAFLSVGLAVASRVNDGRAQTRPLVDKFLEASGLRPRRVEFVAGALTYSKYNFVIRFVMRLIAGKEGGDTDTSRDYEYTDWEALDAFTRDFVPRVRNASLPAATSA